MLVYRFGHKFVFDSNLAKGTVCFKIFKRDVDELLHEDEEERAYQRERERQNYFTCFRIMVLHNSCNSVGIPDAIIC